MLIKTVNKPFALQQTSGCASLLLLFFLLTACSATNPPKIASGHLDSQHIAPGEIPKPVTQTPFLPPPKPAPKLETYTVVVNDVPVKELLFALARDAKLNVDIHPDISGNVTLNAVKQTLPQILKRISEQVSLRYEVDGPNLLISPDIPYIRTYKVDYVNMSRESNSSASVATEIATAGGTVGEGGGGSVSAGNKSRTEVTNVSKSNFWEALIENIGSILGESTAGGQGDAPANASVIANPMSGIISVRATSRQHESIQNFIDNVLANVQRQVLIEATIVEVELSDRYQSGVDWQVLTQSGNLGSLSIASTLTGSNLSTPPAFLLNYSKDFDNTNLTSAVRMLETFGTVKVLSSPKIMALNNQTALLKVVDEKVYFTVERQVEEATDNSPRIETFTSELHTIPVGLVMSVTPQITDTATVSMNVRPTISRITGFVPDPAPRLAGSEFDNLIPEIQIREIESLLKVNSKQTVVLGGLMQNKTNTADNGIPFLSSLPIIGNLFNYNDDEFTKTELVIFLRPTVINNASLDGDFRNFRHYLPDITKSEHRNVLSESTKALETKTDKNNKSKTNNNSEIEG